MVSSDDHGSTSASDHAKTTPASPPAPPGLKTKDTSESTRFVVGNSINRITEFINDNIILARYGTITSVAVLTAYGISKTPLFFRYKSVADIPSSLFSNRKSLYGKIVHVVEKDALDITSSGSGSVTKEIPIVLLVRHLSPVGRLTSFVSKTRGQNININAELARGDLLKVELAGVKAPPFFYAPLGKEGPNEWLKSLAANQPTVKCTLLSRRIVKPFDFGIGGEGLSDPIRNMNIQKKPPPTHGNDNNMHTNRLENPDEKQVAICQIQYRPGMDILHKDLASSLLSFGRANVASGMHIEDPSMNMTTIDGSKKLDDIEADVKYLEMLGKNEFEGVKASKGMWAISSIRDSRPDLVEEAEFDKNAKWYNKLWRRIRGE